MISRTPLNKKPQINGLEKRSEPSSFKSSTGLFSKETHLNPRIQASEKSTAELRLPPGTYKAEIMSNIRPENVSGTVLKNVSLLTDMEKTPSSSSEPSIEKSSNQPKNSVPLSKPSKSSIEAASITVNTTASWSSTPDFDTEKTGPELIDIMVEHPTIDVLLDRSPYAKPYTDAELMQVIEAERRDRARFDIKSKKRQDKKDGIVDEPELTEGETE